MTGMTATTTDSQRRDIIARSLVAFIGPGQWTELRGLGVRGVKIRTATFDGAHLHEAAAQALRWESEGATGVYFVPNPLRPDVAQSRRCAKREDVIARHWLLIDCDPVRMGADGRPADDQKVSSTNTERRFAWEGLDRCRATLEGAGFRGAAVIDSGNGWHLLFPIDLPNDQAAHDQVKELLKGLAKRCGDARVTIDTAPVHANAMTKVPGTLAVAFN